MDWPRPFYRAPPEEEEIEEDSEGVGLTISESGHASKLYDIMRGAERWEEWRRLVHMSTVAPQRSQRLRDM